MRIMLAGLFAGLTLVICGCAEPGNTGKMPVPPGRTEVTPVQKQTTHTLGVRILGYGKYQDQAWTHLPSIGVRNVEIPVPAAEQVEATRRRLAEHGLTAIMLTGKTDLSKPECVEQLGGQFERCRQLGTHYMFLSAKTNGADKQLVYDRLRQAGDIARRNAVTIVLETHPDLMTNGDVALQTMQAINHPNVRVNFDTGNIYFYNQGTTPVAELAKIKDYVASVHLKDTDGGYQSWHFPALGKGVVNFPAVVRTLDARGFTGPYVIEIEGIKGVELDQAQTLQMYADSVAYLRRIAEFR